MLVGTPAFAGEADEFGDMMALAAQYEHNHQVGLVNMEDSEILSDINVCHVDVNVIAVPILSNNDSGLCANPDTEINEAQTHNHHHSHGDDD
ncbi:hypothetical protein ADL03_04995 [Nocardia sp. NRRL S-836]|nr:hypothetical protein ADL03_04995 [Nocardia sp. NRRL S-836]